MSDSNPEGSSVGALGILLMIPAVLACLASWALPSISTVFNSFRDANLLGTGGAEFIGMENYARLFSQEPFGASVGFTFTIIVLRLLMVAILPLLLAFAVYNLPKVGRVILGIVFSVPVVLALPVLVTGGWIRMISRDGPLGEVGLLRPGGAEPLIVLIPDAALTLLLACGLGLVFLVPAMRGQSDEKVNVSALILTWIVGLVATAALSIQSFSMAYLVGAFRANTLGVSVYSIGFRNLELGIASAVVTIVLFWVAILGLLAWALVTFGDLSILNTEPSTGESSRVGMGIGLLAVSVLLLLPVVLLLFVGWVQLLTTPGSRSQQLPILGLIARTYLLPLPVVLIFQAFVSYLAALGIGAMRPLGRRSEILLLPFGLWLFATPLVSSLGLFLRLRNFGLLNSPIASLPPAWVSIPILFILTLYFRGRYYSTSPGEPFFKRFVVPSLPLTVLLAAAALWYQVQAIYWPLLTSTRFESYTFALAIQQTLLSLVGSVTGAVLLYTFLTLVIFLPVAALGHIVVLPRLGIVRGEVMQFEDNTANQPDNDSTV